MSNTTNDVSTDAVSAPTAPVFAEDAMYFSASTRMFYLGRHHARIGAEWPLDARQVTMDQFKTFTGLEPEGHVRGCDDQWNPAWVPASPISGEEASKRFAGKIDSALDSLARSWGYSRGIDNATTWASSSDPQFSAEGKALNTWRDQVWTWASTLPSGTTTLDGMPPAPARPSAGQTSEGKAQ